MTATSPSHLAARLREPGSPSHAALLRVLLGLHVMNVLLSPSLDLLMAIEPSLHPQAHILGGAAVFDLLDARSVELLRMAGIAAACCVTVGLGGRVSVAVMVLAFLSTQLYWFGGTLFHDDWIFFVFPSLVFLCATHPTAWSIDGWLRRRTAALDVQVREARLIVEGWVFWLGFVYLAAGIAKLFPLAKGVEWLAGRGPQAFALEFVRESPAVVLLGQTPFPYDAQWIFALGAVATVVVEVGAVGFWWSRRAYLPLAACIGCMHLGFWLVGIPGFIGMFAVLAAALLPSAGFRRADLRHRQSLPVTREGGSLGESG